MAHVRTQIRDAAKTALTGLPITGSRCYAERVYPMGNDTIPGLIVYTGKEVRDDIAMMGNGVTLLGIDLEVIVEAYIKDTTSAADVADSIYTAVTEALQADATLHGLTKTLEGGTFEPLRSPAEKPVYVARMIFDVTYHMASNNTETAL